MSEENKNAILLIIKLLQTTLAETNTVVGIAINKTDFNKSQLAFVNYESYQKGNTKDGFLLELDELNKEFFK
jgi:hypothetical protein